jgi:hypothetical protein
VDRLKRGPHDPAQLLDRRLRQSPQILRKMRQRLERDLTSSDRTNQRLHSLAGHLRLLHDAAIPQRRSAETQPAAQETRQTEKRRGAARRTA